MMRRKAREVFAIIPEFLAEASHLRDRLKEAMRMSLSLRPEHERMCARHPLAEHLPAGFAVRVFGSRATGASKPFSDLDLALDGDGAAVVGRARRSRRGFLGERSAVQGGYRGCRSVGPVLREAIERDGVALDPSTARPLS